MQTFCKFTMLNFTMLNSDILKIQATVSSHKPKLTDQKTL